MPAGGTQRPGESEKLCRGEYMWKSILTDSHFWVPVAVLVLGIALLVYLQ
jgi:hypothetical protein